MPPILMEKQLAESDPLGVNQNTVGSSVHKTGSLGSAEVPWIISVCHTPKVWSHPKGNSLEEQAVCGKPVLQNQSSPAHNCGIAAA